MFGVGGGELVVIVFIALLIFGPQRIPEIARAVAKGYRELTRLRKQMDSTLDEVKRDLRLDEELDKFDSRDVSMKPRLPVGSAHGPSAQPMGGTYEERGLFEPLPVPAEDDYLAPESPALDHDQSVGYALDIDAHDDYLEQPEPPEPQA